MFVSLVAGISQGALLIVTTGWQRGKDLVKGLLPLRLRVGLEGLNLLQGGRRQGLLALWLGQLALDVGGQRPGGLAVTRAFTCTGSLATTN